MAEQERKIAIVGWAQSSRDEAPWDDKSWEIWACNQMGLRLTEKRYTRWYELHNLDTLRNKGLGEDLLWQKEQPEPCYMQALTVPEFMNGEPFPFEEIIAWKQRRFGRLLENRRYVTSTIAWQILHALWEHDQAIEPGTVDPWGLLHIGLWGVDLAMQTEYAHQRPCTEFYLGICGGLGVDTFVHPASSILRAPYLYGLEDEPDDTGVITPGMVAELRTEAEARREEAILTAAKNEGAMLGYQRIMNIFIQNRRDIGLPAALELPVPKARDKAIPNAANRH